MILARVFTAGQVAAETATAAPPVEPRIAERRTRQVPRGLQKLDAPDRGVSHGADGRAAEVLVARLDGATLVREARLAGAVITSDRGMTPARRIASVTILAVGGFMLTLLSLLFFPLFGVWLHTLAVIVGIMG
jgi:hypothetical protein